ncbi:hypothetical protein HGRIS_001791 [Hohenbuehelia grisea]|uniref:Uncharacterized protein n=1 Tax=Hohenbuehelia grisea TaxID=104357 RepID=A0ABR3JJ63_9AGAR
MDGFVSSGLTHDQYSKVLQSLSTTGRRIDGSQFSSFKQQTLDEDGSRLLAVEHALQAVIALCYNDRDDSVRSMAMTSSLLPQRIQLTVAATLPSARCAAMAKFLRQAWTHLRLIVLNPRDESAFYRLHACAHRYARKRLIRLILSGLPSTMRFIQYLHVTRSLQHDRSLAKDGAEIFVRIYMILDGLKHDRFSEAHARALHHMRATKMRMVNRADGALGQAMKALTEMIHRRLGRHTVAKVKTIAGAHLQALQEDKGYNFLQYINNLLEIDGQLGKLLQWAGSRSGAQVIIHYDLDVKFVSPADALVEAYLDSEPLAIEAALLTVKEYIVRHARFLPLPVFSESSPPSGSERAAALRHPACVLWSYHFFAGDLTHGHVYRYVATTGPPCFGCVAFFQAFNALLPAADPAEPSSKSRASKKYPLSLQPLGLRKSPTPELAPWCIPVGFECCSLDMQREIMAGMDRVAHEVIAGYVTKLLGVNI